jgi:hypothetical protein
VCPFWEKNAHIGGVDFANICCAVFNQGNKKPAHCYAGFA